LLVWLTRARIDTQRIHWARQPAPHRLAHCGGGDIAISTQIALIKAGVACHDRAVGKRDGLAAKAAHLLDRQHTAEYLLRRYALDLIRRRASRDIIADDFIETRGYGSRIDTG